MTDRLIAPAAKIIKSKNQQNVSVVRGVLLKNQVLRAADEARRILRTARENADEMAAQARHEADQVRAEAYRAGRDAAESEIVENVLAIREQRAQSWQTIERDVLKLSCKIAAKIIGRELAQDETARAEIVLTALRQARQQDLLVVRVNAKDLPRLEQLREQVGGFNRAQNVDFVADQAVAEGGCIIESTSGTIDARLETQLRIIENSLLAMLGENQK